MPQTNLFEYEREILEAIATSLGLSVADLRIPEVISLPQSDYELFALLDIVPTESPSFGVNKNSHRFSAVYGQLLQSQPDSFIVTLAKTNYDAAKYWLSPPEQKTELPRVPLYTPDSSEVARLVSCGSQFDFSLDSAGGAGARPPEILYPSYPSLVVNQPFYRFNQITENGHFAFSEHFDKIASPPIRAGGWFSQAAFTQAYQSGGAGWLTGPGTVTWDEMFGDHGTLKYISTGLVAVSGVDLQLRCFGMYSAAIFDSVKANKTNIIWPYYLSVPNLVQEYTRDSDSITITSQVPSPEVLLLLMQAVPASKLVGGT